ncbi:MAG TPA: hypothetical protein VGD67_25150 [Pseudonocardiaceae bacterium]
MRRPIYRVLFKDLGCVEYVLYTCVVAGPGRSRAWLYVHSPTPMVLRLHRDVVLFLRSVLAEVRTLGPGDPPIMRKLDRSELHPPCVVAGPKGDVRLHVLGGVPTCLCLGEPVVDFLMEALADLSPVIPR